MGVSASRIIRTLQEQKGLLAEQDKEITGLEKIATAFRESGHPSEDVETYVKHLRGMHTIAVNMIEKQEKNNGA